MTSRFFSFPSFGFSKIIILCECVAYTFVRTCAHMHVRELLRACGGQRTALWIREQPCGVTSLLPPLYR